jgi:magnesium transporter
MSNARTDSVLITVRRLLQQERNEEVIHLIEALLPADQAEVFLALPEQVQEEILEQIKIQDAADIIEELSDDDAAALAETLDLTVLTQLLDEMEPDEAADLLGDLDPALRDRALAQMISVEAVAPLLGYSDDSAGGLMTSNYHVFSEQASIGQAFRAIREQPTQDDEEIPYVYAVDERGRLTGIARLADLIRAHPDQPLSAIAKREIVSIGADEDQEAAARLLERYDLMALPVLDDRQRLVGVITADDAMAALEEETTEDIYRSAGIYAGGEPNTSKSALLVEGPVWHAWAQRVPFLLISMVGGMLAGGVMGLFEEALEVVVALAFFVPVVMDMGGNAGVQSAAIFIRGQVLGHAVRQALPARDQRRHRYGRDPGTAGRGDRRTVAGDARDRAGRRPVADLHDDVGDIAGLPYPLHPDEVGSRSGGGVGPDHHHNQRHHRVVHLLHHRLVDPALGIYL